VLTRGRIATGIVLVGLLSAVASGVAAQNAPDILVPSGYQVREFASGFSATIAASVAPSGDLYVLNSGFPGFAPGPPGPVQIWKVSPAGDKTLVYSSDQTPGLVPVALGIFATDDDTIFVNDGEGMKRVHRDGSVQMLAKLPVEGDHAADHIAMGADGKLYWGEGSATNSGVVGVDNRDLTGWLPRHPDFHDIPCKDIVLSGFNFSSPDALSDDPNATTVTGAYMPFGTPSTSGQVVQGQLPCTSAVLRMNTDGSGLEMVAWGFRNPFGLAFSPADSVLKGALVVANNGTDVRGSRPIESDGDDVYVVRPGAWYGWPDFLDEQPVTEPRFDPDHQGVAPLLRSPAMADASGAVMHFEKGVSADGFSFSTSDAFGFKNDMFIALWGPLGFGSQNAVPPGFNVVRVHFEEGPGGILAGASKEVFAQNRQPGPASQNDLNGLEHPSDVQFSRDGRTMYIVDFGTPGSPGTGRVWAVTRGGS
jgi:glucose/arabinose dehydrogenase